MAFLKECPSCKKQRPAISFANGICGDCIQTLLALRLAQNLKIKQNQIEEDIIAYGSTGYDQAKIKEAMDFMDSIAPTCSSCGKKHVTLGGPDHNKCNDCRKFEAKVYNCLFCEDQELLLDNRENEQWIYGMNCVCSSCKQQLFQPQSTRQKQRMYNSWSSYPIWGDELEEFKAQICGEIESKYWDAAGTYRFEKVKDTLSSLYYRGQSMLYLHFEEFQILNSQTSAIQDLVKFCFSTSSSEKKIYGAKNFATLKDCNYYTKQIPGNDRTYDPLTNIWVVPKSSFETLKKIYLSMKYIESDSFFKKHDSLQDFIDGISRVKVGQAPKAEEFFYTYGQPTSQATLSKESIASKLELTLTQALGEPVVLAKASAIELLKLYRRAALKLHPDRNNGDGSKMSELNMYWQMYKL